MKDEIVVSVLCTTFNHEKYIADTLNSFLAQETSYNFEIIVHDDASSDGTQDIIKQFQRRYPTLIKPILQSENQYSKHVEIMRDIVYPMARGKYLAFCEGDDYWRDKNKLQKQIDFLERHPDYSACVHNTVQLNCRTGQRSLMTDIFSETDLSVKDIILAEDKTYHYSATVCRTKWIREMPDLFFGIGVGDYPTSIYLALQGKIHYFPDEMSVYRRFVEGSWTTTMEKEDKHKNDRVKEHYKRIANFLDAVNEYSKGEYSEVISFVKQKNDFTMLVSEKRFKKAKKEYPQLWSSKNMRWKMSNYAQKYVPTFYTILKGLLE